MTGRAFSMTTSFAALALALGLISAHAEDMDHSKMDHGAMDHSAHGATQWADPGKAQAAPPAADAGKAEAPKADDHANHHGGGMGMGKDGMGKDGMGGMSHGGGMMGGKGGMMGGMMGGMDHGGGSGGGMSHGGGMGGMMQHMMCGFTEHLEGRLAYLKAELRLTDQQISAWSNFADAWRAAAQKANAKCASMDERPDNSKPAVLQKLDKMENHMVDHLDIVRAQKAAIEPLFTALSDEQRKIASETLTSVMKVGMSMMGGMGHGGGGMMGMGGMGGMGGMSHGGDGMQH